MKKLNMSEEEIRQMLEEVKGEVTQRDKEQKEKEAKLLEESREEDDADFWSPIRLINSKSEAIKRWTSSRVNPFSLFKTGLS